MKANIPFTLIDLTHPISTDIPTWDGKCGFEHQIEGDYDPASLYQFRTHKIHMVEGIGTHIDAPAHCIKGARTIDDLALNELAAPCVVIDVSAKAHELYQVSMEDVKAFEQRHGKISLGSFVIFNTGWSQYWLDAQKYRNNLEFPSVSIDVAEFLLTQRDIVGLGIDTLSPDCPKNGYPVHKAVLGADKYIVENIANADSLPPMGSYSLALPLKIKKGTEAPMRLVGLILSKKGCKQ